MPKNNIYDELNWRGLIYQESGQQMRQILCKKKITLYAGFDPTADSLHIGSLVPLITLNRFQKYGHRALALAGGATGLIGDPSGKNQERNLLDDKTIERNLQGIRQQLTKLISLDEKEGKLVNNKDWLQKLDIIRFLRDVGKHFSINMMLSKESISARLENKEMGLSFTEFTYMVLQAYDFYHLYKEENCSLQIGGSDQWGNMTAGMDLIRRLNGEAHCLTVPLIMTSDGKKFGKTERGAIWLDKDKTCPYDFYQYWINTNDDDVIRFIKFFTFLDEDEVSKLEKQNIEEPHFRAAQKKLAFEVTSLIHGEKEAQKNVFTTQALFGTGELGAIDIATFESLHLTTQGANYKKLKDIQGLLAMLSDSKITQSNNQARDAVKSGGVYINNEKVTDATFIPTNSHLFHNHYLVLRRGKKKMVVIKIN